MIRKYSCQTDLGARRNDKFVVDLTSSSKIAVNWSSDLNPCTVYLNAEQVKNLVDVFTHWLDGEGDTAPKLWEDA